MADKLQNTTPPEMIKFGDLEVPVHPAAEMFPMMDDAELDELAADIERNGLYQAIAYQNGELLDGRNRLAAIYRIKDEKRRNNLLGFVASTKRALEVRDPLAYVVSANLYRRPMRVRYERDSRGSSGRNSRSVRHRLRHHRIPQEFA